MELDTIMPLLRRLLNLERWFRHPTIRNNRHRWTTGRFNGKWKKKGRLLTRLFPLMKLWHFDLRSRKHLRLRRSAVLYRHRGTVHPICREPMQRWIHQTMNRRHFQGMTFPTMKTTNRRLLHTTPALLRQWKRPVLQVTIQVVVSSRPNRIQRVRSTTQGKTSTTIRRNI